MFKVGFSTLFRCDSRNENDELTITGLTKMIEKTYCILNKLTGNEWDKKDVRLLPFLPYSGATGSAPLVKFVSYDNYSISISTEL